MRMKGTATRKYGDNINTDYIISADLLQESWDSPFFASHAFEKYDPEFVSLCSGRKDNVVVAGENFGCGSSREQAVHAIKHNGVAFVLAKSYPDIFYRNSINNGLIVIKTDTSDIREGDELELDISGGTLMDLSTGVSLKLLNNRNDLRMFEEGDRLSYVRERLKGRLGRKKN